MNRIVLILGIAGCCWGSAWDFGGHGGLTLGEISLGGHGHELPAISLGDSGHGGLSLGGSGISLGEHSGGFDSGFSIGGGHGIIHGAHVIPVIKEVGVPVLKPVEFKVPHPVVESVPQPYPVPVVVSQPVPYEVVKPVVKKVEKKVPTPVEKLVPFKIEKPVPYKVVKHIPVPVVKPIPIKIPVYKTIVHRSKSHH